jgi:hypothetical protein
MFTTLSVDQRVMWVVWTWVLAGAWFLLRRGRRPSTPAGPAPRAP